MAIFLRGEIWHYEFTVRGVRERGSTGERKERRALTYESIKRAEAMNRNAPPERRKAPLLSAAAKLFLEEVEKEHEAGNKKANTVRHYRNAWDAWIKGTELAGMRVDRIRASHINAIRFPGGPFTAKNARQALGHILNWCAEQGWIIAGPKLKSTRVTGRKVRITQEIEQALRMHMKRDVSDVFTVMLDDVMRNCEVFAMEWARVDWVQEKYHVAKSKSPASQRTIPLSKRVMAMLTARKDMQDQVCAGDSDNLETGSEHSRIRRGTLGSQGASSERPANRKAVAKKVTEAGREQNGPRNSIWVFPSRVKRCGHVTTVAKQFREARELAGIPAEVKLYCSRHTGASELAEMGVDLLTLRELLGHEDISTTNKYLHGEAAKARDAINQKQRDRSGLKLERMA